MPGDRRPNAAIVGAGVAGLAAAIALRQAGYAVEVFDRAPQLEPAGGALSLWANAVAALDRLGALDRIVAEAAPIETMMLGEVGRAPLIGPMRIRDRAYLATRTLLQRTLLDALDDVQLHLGTKITTVDQTPDAARLILDDDRRVTADIVVIADGVWSPTATALLGNAPTYRGYGGVLGVSDPIDEADDDGLLVESWGRNERFGIGDVGGGRRYWFYMHDAPAGAPLPTHAFVSDRAPGFQSRALARAIAATAPGRLIPFPIHARPAPRRLGKGRILCVGDAAHAMEPNLGQGACQALEDAVALRIAAERQLPADICRAVERMRLARIRMVVRRATDGRYMVHGPRWRQRLARGAFRLVPNAIIARSTAQTHRMPL